MKARRWAIGMMLLGAIVLCAGAVQAQTVFDFYPEYGYRGENPTWFLEASDPWVIGNWADPFSYDGSKVTALNGRADMLVDVNKDFGIASIDVRGQINPQEGRTYEGVIKVIYRFNHDEDLPDYAEGGIADYIHMHGDTGHGAPVLPTLRAFVAAWGMADVYVNGDLVYNDLPGHVMYTEHVRDPETGAVYAANGEDYYDPDNPTDFSIAAPNRRELHFVAHRESEETGNVWLHFNFQEVRDRSTACPTYFR